MSHTKSHNHIQIRLLAVQKLCLQDRITHVNTDFTALLRNSHLCLIHTAGFTGNSHHFKLVIPKDGCQRPAFFQQSHTGGDPDLFRPDLSCEFNNFFHPGVLTIMFILYLGCRHHYLMIFRFLITFHGILKHLRIQMGGDTERRKITAFFLCITPFDPTVDTRHFFYFHSFFLPCLSFQSICFLPSPSDTRTRSGPPSGHSFLPPLPAR